MFIKSILKSLVILAMWLALNCIFFSANENGTVQQNNQSDFKAHIAGNWFWQNDLAIDFKTDLMKWQLNFGSCNFGLKSYFDFKSNSRWTLVRFWNHAYDFRPNCTPLSSITMVKHTKCFVGNKLFISKWGGSVSHPNAHDLRQTDSVFRSIVSLDKKLSNVCFN